MNKRVYEIITSPIINNPYGVQIIKTMDKTITGFIYFIYPLFLFSLIFYNDVRFWRTLLVPGISFLIVSIFRKHTNCPRPYEVLDIIPIIDKNTKGKSFPSRHVFSIFVIGVSLYFLSSLVGIFIMFLGIVLAIIRVLGGVHFPKDVVAGAIVGILFGLIGQVLF